MLDALAPAAAAGAAAAAVSQGAQCFHTLPEKVLCAVAIVSRGGMYSLCTGLPCVHNHTLGGGDSRLACLALHL